MTDHYPILGYIPRKNFRLLFLFHTLRPSFWMSLALLWVLQRFILLTGLFSIFSFHLSCL